MKNNNQTILILAVIGLVVIAYQMGGVPFLGALVMFEGGNEIMFTEAETEITKEVNATTGENITVTHSAVTDVERELELKSKYIENAYMRLYGTPGISNASIAIEYTATIDNDTQTIREPIWTQPEPFEEIDQIDLTEDLSGKEEGDMITFKFHSDTPGSLIISTFNVDWGPTQAQIQVCKSTEGAFNEETVTCECPSDSIGFDWETGCEFEEPEETTTTGSGATSTVSSPSPTPTTSLTTPKPSFNLWKIMILVLILGLLIYYYGYEKGPKRGFVRK